MKFFESYVMNSLRHILGQVMVGAVDADIARDSIRELGIETGHLDTLTPEESEAYYSLLTPSLDGGDKADIYFQNPKYDKSGGDPNVWQRA
jgi:hypothetical protein